MVDREKKGVNISPAERAFLDWLIETDEFVENEQESRDDPGVVECDLEDKFDILVDIVADHEKKAETLKKAMIALFGAQIAVSVIFLGICHTLVYGNERHLKKE